MLLSQPPIKALFKALEPFDARLVGGCVRDALLGLESTDIDVAVAAPPEEISQHLKQQGIKVIPTGIEFGTITAVIHHQGFQITSLRQDVKTDGRHAQVSFGTDWLEDAKRRDFTINALSLDSKGTLYYYFNGQDDLKAGCIRFIGDADQRIREDYLRILRYYRFLAYFGKGNPLPIPALHKLRAGLKQLSVERIQQEILKLLASPAPHLALKLMAEDGIFETLYDHSVDLKFLYQLIEIEKVLKIPSNPLRRLWALFQKQDNFDLSLRGAEQRGNLPEDDNSSFYQTYFRLSHTQLRFLKSMGLYIGQRDRRLILYKQGYSFFESWCVLRSCTEADMNLPQIKSHLEWAQSQLPLTFPFTGQDLLNEGMSAGPAMGKLLGKCEQWWIENDFKPSQQECLIYCQNEQARSAD